MRRLELIEDIARAHEGAAGLPSVFLRWVSYPRHEEAERSALATSGHDSLDFEDLVSVGVSFGFRRRAVEAQRASGEFLVVGDVGLETTV